MDRRNVLMFRWSLVTAGAIALFWLIWHWITGSVPAITEMELPDSQFYQLPFELSRWWDVLIGPLYSCVLVYLITKAKAKDDKKLTKALVSDFNLGITTGLIAVLLDFFDIHIFSTWWTAVLFYILFFLLLGFISHRLYRYHHYDGDTDENLVFAIFGGALIICLVYGLFFGLFVGFIFFLSVYLLNKLMALLKIIFSKKSINWLMAKDKKQ